MLYRVLATLKHLNYRNHSSSGFDSYLAGIQRYNAGGGPRMEEARKDYIDMVNNQTAGFMG